MYYSIILIQCYYLVFFLFCFLMCSPLIIAFKIVDSDRCRIPVKERTLFTMYHSLTLSHTQRQTERQTDRYRIPVQYRLIDRQTDIGFLFKERTLFTMYHSLTLSHELMSDQFFFTFNSTFLDSSSSIMYSRPVFFSWGRIWIWVGISKNN